MSDETVSDAAAATNKMAADRAAGDERLAYRGIFQRILTRPEIGAAIAALGIWVFFWAVSVPFGKAGGAAQVLDVASSPLGIMAVAVAMLMIGGEFDLSAGAATGALGIITILMVREVVGAPGGGWGLSLWVAIPLALLAALGLGWFNGTVVEKTGLPSFIVTLGSFFVLVGAKLGFSKLLVGQQQVGKLDDLQSVTAYIGNDGTTVNVVDTSDPDALAAVPDDVTLFEVVPPVIDVIEDNLFNESDSFAGLDPSVFESGDRGYGVLVDIFAGEWSRNDHIWDGRDWFYSIGVLAGLSLMALAIYELHFERKEHQNPLGLGVFAVGIAAALAGVWQLHATDSTGGNWIGSILIAVGMLGGFVGWGMWRYRSRSDLDDAVEDMIDDATEAQYSPALMTPLGIGAVAFVLAIVVARWLDPQVSEKFTTTLGLSGLGIPLVALLVGGLAAALLHGRALASSLNSEVQSPPIRPIAATIIAGFIATMLFFDLTTEQGARAIFFLALSGLAAVMLVSAAGVARRHSQPLGSAVLLLTSAAVVVMAFFVRSESTSPKFRAQAFAVLLALAALMAVWSVATLLFRSRSGNDPAADRTGSAIGIVGALLAVVGLTVRLLWVTTDEIAAEIPPATFSVRILWFLGFTAVCSWILARTQFGSWTFAVGGNKEAARQVGVPAARTKTQLFMLVSAAAWLVGLLLAFRLNNIQANTGDGQEFQYIIAAVVGGTFLTGGYGSTIGAAIGAVIIAMSRQGIPSARWNSDWRFVFIGAILLLAVVANNLIRTKAEAAR